MVSIRRPLGYGPSTLPLCHSALSYKPRGLRICSLEINYLCAKIVVQENFLFSFFLDKANGIYYENADAVTFTMRANISASSSLQISKPSISLKWYGLINALSLTTCSWYKQHLCTFLWRKRPSHLKCTLFSVYSQSSVKDVSHIHVFVVCPRAGHRDFLFTTG